MTEMNTSADVYDTLTECIDAIDTLQSKELHRLWKTRPFKSEEFMDDTSDDYTAFKNAKEHIRKAMLELEGIFE